MIDAPALTDAPAPLDGELYEDQTFQGLIATNTELRGAEFQDCRFGSCSFTGASWKSVTLIDCEFIDCDLSNLVAVDCRFRDVRFERCKLMGIAWERAASVASPHFTECKLDYGSFDEVDLSHADLRGACGYAIHPTENKLKQARFSLPEAVALLKGLDIRLDDED